MVSSIQFNPNVQLYGQGQSVSGVQKVGQQDESIFTQAKKNEDGLVSTDFEADAAQLKDDWNYFKELESGVKKGDQEAINEVLSIQAADKVDGTDSNAIQYNANTDLLLKIQQEANSASANTSSNPFA